MGVLQHKVIYGPGSVSRLSSCLRHALLFSCISCHNAQGDWQVTRQQRSSEDVARGFESLTQYFISGAREYLRMVLSPGRAGSLLLDNVVMKGDRKDSGSGTKPGQLVRAGE